MNTDRHEFAFDAEATAHIAGATEKTPRRDIARPAHIFPDILLRQSADDIENSWKKYLLLEHRLSTRAGKIAMYRRAASLPLLLTTWVLVADDRQAQLYELGRIAKEGVSEYRHDGKQSECVFTPVKDGLIEAGMIGDGLMDHYLHDVAESDYGQARDAHGFGDYIKEEINRRFIASIAAKLHQSCGQKLFDKLILISSPKLIVTLKEQLNDSVQNCIAGIVPRECAGYRD